MDIFFTCFVIGISLSMDAFSLSIVYGTVGFSLYKRILLSFVVGIFHFFMPIIGFLFGSYIQQYFIISTDIFVGVIFGLIGIEMLLSLKEENRDILFFNKIWEYFIFGFTVSLDSLTTGIGLSMITRHYVIASFIFMICSSLFTFLGLSIGSYFKTNFDKYATLLGGILMMILAIMYLL